MESLLLPSAGSLAVAAIALFMAAMQGFFFLRKPEYSWNGWGCMLSLATFAYSMATVLQYNSGEVPFNHTIDRLQLTAILFIVHAIYGFTYSFFRIPSRKLHITIGSVNAVFVILLWFTDYIVTDGFVRKQFLLLNRPYVESEYGVLGAVFLSYMVLTATLSLSVWIRRYREKPGEALWYLVGAGLWLVLSLHDFLASLGMPAGLFLMEYGFLGFSIFVLSVTVKDYIGLFAIIREREAALEKEMESLFITLRSIGEGVIATDAAGLITLMNPVAEELTGWKEGGARSRPLKDVFMIIDAKTRMPIPDPVLKAGSGDRIVELKGNIILIARDGNERIIADSCAPMHGHDGDIIGFVIVFRDITDRIRMEEMLVKARNIESLAVLAGGIAHDFNNILTSIVGNISLACLNLDPADETFRMLTDAKKASFSAKDLTNQLLAFSRGGAPVKRTATLGGLIRDTVEFALSGSRVKCDFSIPGDLWPAEIDQGQISQVLNNVVINAVQAMEEGGDLEVRAENISAGKSRVITGLDEPQHMPSGRYVKLTVKDNGPGIPRENLKKIFDPYFTTKRRGMGLGLATAYSIIKKHDGFISVESFPGAGTTFSFYLPAAEGTAPGEDAAGERIFGNGRILVVDDEEEVIRVSVRLIESLGYRADSAMTIDGALEKYQDARNSGEPFACVIIDLTMPGTDGARECLRKLKEKDGNITAVVSSGYGNDPVMMEYWNFGFVDALKKPYMIEELGKVLHRAVNRSAGESPVT
jgi:PAS domain S-box-containing protein